MATMSVATNLSSDGSSSMSGGATATYQSILGALLVAMWTTKDNAGVGLGSGTFASGTIDTWTDQIQTPGVVLQAPSAIKRPLYAADGGVFGGRSIVQSQNAVASCVLNTAAPALLLSGSRPYLCSVMRWQTYPVATRWAFRSLDASSGVAGPAFLQSSGTTLQSGLGANAAFSDTTAAHMFEAFYDSVGTAVLAIDTVAAASAGSGGSIAADMVKFSIGGAVPSGSNVADVSHALHILCSAAPSTVQRAQLFALSRLDFGY